MTSSNGVGYTGDPIEQIAEAGYLRTEDTNAATITRGSVTTSTYILEPLLAVLREMQYYSGVATANFSTDYDFFLQTFLAGQTLTQPVTYESFASDFVDFMKIRLVATFTGSAANPDFDISLLTTAIQDDLKSRLAIMMDLTVQAGLGISQYSQNSVAMTNALIPSDSNAAQALFFSGLTPPMTSLIAYVSSLESTYETTDRSPLNTGIEEPPATWAFDNFPTFNGFPSDVIEDISERAFVDLITNIAPVGGNFTTLVFFHDATENYFVRFAHIPDYMNVVAAFTAGLTDAQQAAIFKNYIVNLYFNPANDNSFRMSADIGPFIEQMSANYLSALTGSSTNVNSSVSGSFPKVRILQRIYALIVEMIGVIQEVTASQSQQLKIMTQVQADMTSLMNDIHVFTSGDDSEVDSSSSTSSDQTNRDSLNTVGTAWSDTIRANRDFLQNAAKSYQSNINSSNDAVNQQASMATSFIQELSTLLGAIYR